MEVSICCNAKIIGEDICSLCKEHTKIRKEYVYFFSGFLREILNPGEKEGKPPNDCPNS